MILFEINGTGHFNDRNYKSYNGQTLFRNRLLKHYRVINLTGIECALISKQPLNLQY